MYRDWGDAAFILNISFYVYIVSKKVPYICLTLHSLC